MPDAFLEQRSARVGELRQEAQRLLTAVDHPPMATLIAYALSALDEADKWLGKPGIDQREALKALVDVELAAAEGRLKIVITLLEQYGAGMGWDD